MYHLRKGFEANKLYALYTGNLDLIESAWKDNTSLVEWYKFIFDPAMKSNIAPIQSNVVKNLTGLINDVLYSKVNFDYDKENTTLDVDKFVKELETTLQLFDVVGVRWSLVDNKYIPKIYVNNTFGYEFDEFKIGKHFYYHYYTEKINNVDTKFKLVSTIDGNWEYNELYQWQQNEWKKVPLETLDYLADVPEEYNHTFDTSFIFQNDGDLKHVISLVELMDEALTFMSMSTLLSLPTTYLPEDAALESGTNASVDEQAGLMSTLRKRACGLIKVPYLDQNYQRIDTDQPIIQVDNYIKVKDEAYNEILNIIGINDTDNLPSNLSGEAIMRLEERTRRFRDNTLNERVKQLQSMFDIINFNIKINILPFFDNVDVDRLVKLSSVVNVGNLSKRTMLKLSFPHWTDDEIKTELSRQNLQVGDLDLVDIGN